MHDCPGCQVPLHGHERFCPVCGQKQIVRPEFQGTTFDKFQKGFNPIGLILGILLIIGLGIFAVQSSWIGQLIRRGPIQVSEAALSAPAAREKLESAVLQSLSDQSKTCKFIYMADDKEVDRNHPNTVQLNIDVNLKDPSTRKTIVEPAKSLMEPGKISTLTLNDAHSHATITYSLATGANTESQSAENESPTGAAEQENTTE
jgi:hypothetical protein